MSVTMSIYDITTAWNALGRNPLTVAEMDTIMDDVATTLHGTRPFNTTYGYWADNAAPGYDLTQYDYIAATVDYQVTITEDTTYEFNINSDDYGDLHLNGTLVSYEAGGSDSSINTPIALVPGTYTLSLRMQNGVGPWGFNISWKKQGEVDLYPLDYASVGLPKDNKGNTPNTLIETYAFIDYPHKLTIKTELDGVAVKRRVVIRNRNSLSYVASAITDDNGFVEFSRLPTQSLSNPHVITCYDDRDSGFLNALVYDRVFQVSNQGFPPEN